MTSRGLSNTGNMIRVDRVNWRVDFCISLRRLRNFVAGHVGKRPCVMVVESYESYKWRKWWSARQSELLSRQMLSLRGLRNLPACLVGKTLCM